MQCLIFTSKILKNASSAKRSNSKIHTQTFYMMTSKRVTKNSTMKFFCLTCGDENRRQDLPHKYLLVLE